MEKMTGAKLIQEVLDLIETNGDQVQSDSKKLLDNALSALWNKAQELMNSLLEDLEGEIDVIIDEELINFQKGFRNNASISEAHNAGEWIIAKIKNRIERVLS